MDAACPPAARPTRPRGRENPAHLLHRWNGWIRYRRCAPPR